MPACRLVCTVDVEIAPRRKPTSASCVSSARCGRGRYCWRSFETLSTCSSWKPCISTPTGETFAADSSFESEPSMIHGPGDGNTTTTRRWPGLSAPRGSGRFCTDTHEAARSEDRTTRASRLMGRRIYNPTVTLHLLLAVALAHSGDQAALPDLREALASERPAERAEAAFGLGQFGLVDVPEGEREPETVRLARAAAADLLAPAVSDPAPAVRGAAVTALGQVAGRDSESFLLAAATDYDAGVRGAAALALFRQRLVKRVTEYSAPAVGRLVQLAADADPEVRWRAAYAFSRWSEPRAAAALAALSADADARARLFAVRALGKLKAAPDAARLADADLYVRAEAVAALSAAKAWDKLPDAVFADPSAHVRAAAADAAAASGDARRFVPLLEKLAAEPGTLASGRAVLALAKLGDAAAVDRAAADPRWWLRARAAEGSASLPDAEARLLKAASDPDPRVASQALETLAASTSTAVLALYDRSMRDPKAELEVRGAVVDAAGDLADPGLLDGLAAAKAFAKGPGSAELREGLIKAFQATAARHPETAARV
ncbi:MAG: HEAT repeat domain-containing protein, partial [Elusimicrobia bacterium]|nr:HEAT repeat domain-containing protein [Elusimicrobiota bacterium]